MAHHHLNKLKLHIPKDCVQYLRNLMNSFEDLCDLNNSIAMETSNPYVQRNIKHKIQLENDVIFYIL